MDESFDRSFAIFALSALSGLETGHTSCKPTILTDFPWFDSLDGKAATLNLDLLSFLNDGPPPLVVSLGSFVPFAAQEFYHRAAEMVRELKMRAVLLTQFDQGIAERSIKVVSYAPHSLLFPHAAAIIHHGGVGATGQTLRSGKPQMIVPWMGDQFDHARRLEKLGAGFSATVDKFMRSGAVLVQKLLGDPNYRRNADRIAQKVRAENGAACAAAEILEVMRT